MSAMRKRLRRQRGQSVLREERGQSIVEYMLVLAVIVTALMLVLKLLKDSDFFYKKISEPLVKHITYNYKYADSRAQGWDEGSPKLHIQISRPNEGQTFRMFQPKE